MRFLSTMPTIRSTPHWVEKFKKEFGPDLCEEDLHAQTYYEDF